MKNNREALKRIERAAKCGQKRLNLSKLYLNTHDLEQLIPVIAKKLPSLKVLDLAHNAFNELPYTVKALKRLVELDVSFNQSTFKYVKQLKRLKNLVVSFDQYTTLQTEMQSLQSLLVYRLTFEKLPVSKQYLN